MARFEVDSDQIMSASGLTKNSAQTIRAEVAAMMAHLVALQDSWRGGASAAFSGVLEQWRATQQQVDDSLDAIAMSLDSGSRHYDDAESSNLRMFAR